MNTKNLLFLVFLLCYLLTVNAQWIRQTNGLPDTWSGGWAIDASDSNNVLIAISSDIYYTTNGGNQWNKVELPDTIIGNPIDVSIIGDSHFWITTDIGKIIATTDAGLIWEIQYDDTSKTNFMNYIEMFDEMHGVAMGDAPFPLHKKPAVFHKTTDGGSTWTQSHDTTLIDIFSGDSWRRLDFVNPNFGYFYESGLNPQRLLKTTDGSESWSTTKYSGSATLIKCFDENIVLVHSIVPTKISRTKDGGNSWEETLLSTGWGNDFEFIPGDASKIFFTDHDNLFFSNDTGKTWHDVFVDTIDIKARDIVFSDKNHGWILGDSGRVYKTSTGGLNSDYTATDYIAANEIFMWIGNNGMGSHDPRTDGSGFYWPGGKNAAIPAIFADGLVWGGKVDGEIRVNGSTYRYGLTPGHIMPDGRTSDPFETKSKIFKLKRNWQTLPPSLERNRYEFDYLNWPVDIGAPWDDKNGDGVYTLGIDEPKIIGDETLFFVANDLDTSTTLYTYGSNPIGLEFQVTIFGFNNELLKDVVFKKYKVINKGDNDITDMYFTYWADDDLGDANDDYIGFDTAYNMGYVFNGDDNDFGYYGTPPPAVAHMIVQGPIVQASINDSARFGNCWKKGFINLGITACGMILKNYMQWPHDVTMGNYSGTLQFYYMMQGLNWDGSQLVNPISGQNTIWPLSGDPVSHNGWYMGDGWPGGPNPMDVRYHIPSGPFTLAVGDTQEVVIAILIKKGTDNLNSITELKNYAEQIQHWYDNDFVVGIKEAVEILPLKCSLSQNYPNPFNPTTKIKYSIPNVLSTDLPTKAGKMSQRNLKVVLKVYDILGNEVSTLVNEEKPAGSYEVEFDGSKLSSGVYFYQLKSLDFIQTKKMILMK